MSKTKFLLISLLLLSVSWLAYIAFSTGWEKVDQEVGLSNEARSKPLLAATLLLQKRGIELKRLKDASHIFKNGKIIIPTDYSLIMDEAVLTEIDAFESAIIRWVKAGGHLIYVLSPRRDALYLDNNQLLKIADLNVVKADTPQQRVGVTDKPEANINIALNAFTLELNMPYSHHFTDCKGTGFQSLALDLTLVCELSIYDGRITFIPSVHPISNSSLKHLDHGQFLYWLTDGKKGLFYLPSQNTQNWLESLWNWSWQFIVLLLLSLFFYMWNVAIRIGLPETPSQISSNRFADHIEAAGNFMITHNHHQELKMALLKDLEYVMEKRIPTYKELSLSEQADLMSQSTGKACKDIEHLLSEPMPLDNTERLQFIKSFKELRKLL